MHVQIVQFNLEGVTEDGYRELCAQLAPAFADLPGLLTKLWLADPATNTYGGVYLWRDREAMEGYLASELFQGVRGHPNLRDVTTREFAVDEDLTRVTQTGIRVVGEEVAAGRA